MLLCTKEDRADQMHQIKVIHPLKLVGIVDIFIIMKFL